MNITDFTKLKPAEYARKSSESEDKQMLSITSQHEANHRSAEYHKLSSFVESFEESRSAKTEFTRPEFSRMMDLIDKGLIDCIVCWKPDRLARNMTEGGKIIDALSSGKLKAIITHDKVFYPWDNVIVLAVEFSQGKQYVKELSINVKRGQRTKASTQGYGTGNAPIGFLNSKEGDKGNRWWDVDEERFWKVKKLFELFLGGGYSVGKLHKYAVEVLHLNTAPRRKSGGHNITIANTYKMLKTPIYAGFFYVQGTRYDLNKNLPRAITEAQHKLLLEMISNNKRPKVQKHDAVFSGFILSNENDFIGQDVKFQLVCDCKSKFAYRNKTHCPKCDKRITQIENPKYTTQYYYYNNRKKKAGLKYKSVTEHKITSELVSEVIDKIELPALLLEWSKEYISELKDK